MKEVREHIQSPNTKIWVSTIKVRARDPGNGTMKSKLETGCKLLLEFGRELGERCSKVQTVFLEQCQNGWVLIPGCQVLWYLGWPNAAARVATPSIDVLKCHLVSCVY